MPLFVLYNLDPYREQFAMRSWTSSTDLSGSHRESKLVNFESQLVLGSAGQASRIRSSKLIDFGENNVAIT